MEKTRRLQHFESTEKTTDHAILGLMTGLCESIVKILDTESVLTELRTNTTRKLELWEELKILAFTRTTALVYATSLLVTSLRVHLNIIGGYLYKDTLSESNGESITKEVQTIYNLVLIQHLMGPGLNQLVKIIRENVLKIMKNHSLKEKMALCDMEQLFWAIQHAVDKDVNKNLVQFILPAEIHRNQQEEILNKMLADSLDVFECGDFIEIYEASVSSGFRVVIDKVADFYSEPANGKNQLNGTLPHCEPSTSKATAENLVLNQSNGYVNINKITLPIAKLIPILNALTSQIPSNNANDNKKNLASSIVVLQLQNQSPKNLAANVYEVYSN